MRFDVLTLFPEMLAAYLNGGVLGRAVKAGVVDVNLINIRDFATGPHRTTDDRPYGGGEGMVMKPEPIHGALKSVPRLKGKSSVILLSPGGRPFDQSTAWEMSGWDQVILVCGRYEGVDERIVSTFIDMELSIGDYVLTGGELPALVVIDSVVRLIPGVISDINSAITDSFFENRLDSPYYTRPEIFRGMQVPEVLLSGNHAEISKWQEQQSLERTRQRRRDLLESDNNQEATDLNEEK